jgi:hypothetical protein
MNAKNIIVQHKKKGPVKLGSLSHNELCRTVAELLNTNRELQMTLKDGWEAYQKQLAIIEEAHEKPHEHNKDCIGTCSSL